MNTKNTNLIKAIIAVMNDVKNVEKNLTVGDGQGSYKGVSDKDVKHKVGEAMAKAGLTIVCTDIQETLRIERWVDNYGKPKQQIFTEVKNTYLLMHESGESIEVKGYGHGIDSQDKSAGKATTYALKNALLYTFLVPTGSLDDTDNTHSDNLPTPPASQPAKQAKPSGESQERELPWLNLFNRDKSINQKVHDRLKGFFEEGKSIDELKQSVRINKEEIAYITTQILGHND